jgi:glycosyltransferase involved in cell wall biosynthesis
MQSIFGGKSNCKLVRHETNAGVSAGILTGIRAADHEIVASMDCDCSYDPLELKQMLPRLVEGVDMVTASPYHPDGKVKNVPGWRLLLSKGLSQMYRCVLPLRLHTWTSCFRVYRKSAVKDLPLVENGFLGTAEMVAQLSLAGSTIVEHPATLEVRIFGESKMKTVRTIGDHLRLIAGILCKRWFSKASPRIATRSVSEETAHQHELIPRSGYIPNPGVSHKVAPPQDESNINANPEGVPQDERENRCATPLPPFGHPLP